MTRTVMARIKRMGKQFASCGVPVTPPPHLKGKASAKRLCPKLVPGQVITVPEDHNLLNQDAIEIVRRIEKDEFARPWAFKSAEEALLANPSKSRLGADQIAAGLNLAAGARDKGKKALAEREAAREEEELRQAREERMTGRRPAADEDDDFYGDTPARADDEDDYRPNPQNRVSPDERDDILRRDAELTGEDDPEDAEPVRGRGRGRATVQGDAARAPRKRRG